LRAHIQDARPDAPRQSIASAQGEGVEMEQLRQDQLELLRLRNEVRQLREQASPATADSRPLASQPLKSSATALLPAGDEARQLAIAAMGGDTSAVDKLARLAAGIRTLNPDEITRMRANVFCRAIGWVTPRRATISHGSTNTAT